ncbi:MAG: TonB-dependent receptor [Thermococcus sp.]|nr:TonB-dependent receptor [Thermococcus sp.]
MGHTLYYKYACGRWEDLKKFLREISEGLSLEVSEEEELVIINSPHPGVEALIIRKSGEEFVKTNKIEPYHSLYRLIIHSLAFFGSLEVWED